MTNYYKLPEGWTLETVQKERELFTLNDRMWPVGTGPGVVAWGVPTEPIPNHLLDISDERLTGPPPKRP